MINASGSTFSLTTLSINVRHWFYFFYSKKEYNEIDVDKKDHNMGKPRMAYIHQAVYCTYEIIAESLL